MIDPDHRHSWCECPKDGHCLCGRTVCAVCSIDKAMVKNP